MRDYARTDPARRPLTGNYRKATFIYRGPAGDAIIEEVGFRTKGHYNRPYPEDVFGDLHRGHFKVKFNRVFEQPEGSWEWEERSQRRFCKLRELEFRLNSNAPDYGQWDTSQMREFYANDLLNRAGVYASRVRCFNGAQVGSGQPGRATARADVCCREDGRAYPSRRTDLGAKGKGDGPERT